MPKRVLVGIIVSPPTKKGRGDPEGKVMGQRARVGGTWKERESKK